MGEVVTHQEDFDRLCSGLPEIALRFVPDPVERAQAAKGAALVGVTGFVINWEWLAAELIAKLTRNVLDLALEYGRVKRPAIEQAAMEVIRGLVRWNIPGLPEAVEVKLDAYFAEKAYQVVQALLDVALRSE